MKTRAILSFILSVILILGGIIPATAEQTGTVLDDSLIWHYDFEGDTLAEQTTDKASGGQSQEVITTTEATFTNGQATIQNGVASVTGSSGMNSYIGKTAGKKGSDYLNNATGQFTFFISFRVDGDNATSGGFCDILKTSDESLRVYTSTCNTTKQTVQLVVRSKNSANSDLANGKVVANIPYSYGDNTFSDFINLVWTMKYDGEMWKHVCYLSTNDGMTYDKVWEATAADSATFFNAPTWMSLGNKVAKRASCILHFDDFRIYNKALTVGELQYHLNGVEAATGAVCHGVQVSNFASTDSSYALRFVGSIDSLTAYKEVGFEITAGEEYKWDFATEEVYQSLIASDETGMVEQYTAAMLRGEDSYLYAISITEIPLEVDGVDATYTFTVKPYSIAIDSNTRVYGQAYEFTFTAGVFQSAAKS